MSMTLAQAIVTGMPMEHNSNQIPNPGGMFAVGSFIGGTYRVLGFIGQGGMGLVYKVEHLMMAKVMALKILKSEQVSQEVWKRFRTEAQAIARLDHPNVVRIYDMSQTSDGMPYYTMDFLVGESLADYLGSYDQLPVAEALPIFRQVCSGLAYAHDHGIVHRDIKPDNIMLIADSKENAPPIVKIVDFGIAKLTTFDGVVGQGLTRPGEVFGSPLYMSPEQCSGQLLDYRTDMYSVGVTMFQALTGRPPLLGKSAIETIAMHQTVAPPSLASAAPNIKFPYALERIVARLLAKAPEHRYDSLADVARELLYLERCDNASLDKIFSDVALQGNTLFPHAWSESGLDKSNQNQQCDSTVGFITGAAGDTKFFSTKNLKGAALFSVVLLAILGLVGSILLIRERQRVAAKIAANDAALKSAPSVAELFTQKVGIPSSSTGKFFDRDLTPQEAKKIEAFLNTQKKPYAHKDDRSNNKFELYDFPSDFSVGTYSFDDPYVKYKREGEAQGAISVPIGVRLNLQTSAAVSRYPDLLRYFRPNDIRYLLIGQMDTLDSKMAPNIQRLTGVYNLAMNGAPLVDSDLIWLEKMPQLGCLNISNSKITAAALAKSLLLPRLLGLSAQHVVNIAPVLKVLADTGRIGDLDIAYTKADGASIDQIVKMSNLWHLDLRGANITDADLRKLTRLPKLQSLDIRACTTLTSKIYDSFKRFKLLNRVGMPYDAVDERKSVELKKTSPKIHLYE